MKNPIKTSIKDFKNRRKAYPSIQDAFKELVTNGFFAPNVKKMELHFVDKSFWFMNDGEPMKQEKIVDVLSTYGCESMKTAGNENGIGLKSAASFFNEFDDSMLVLASKCRGNLCGICWIDNDGNYCEKEDFSIEQLDFVKNVLSTFSDGTVTMVYNTTFNKEDVDEFTKELRYMFTTGLNKIEIKLSYKNEDIDTEYPISFYDRHYQHLPYVRRNNEDVSFKFGDKIFKCTLLSTDTRTINEYDYEYIDLTNGYVTHDFGVHMGYDNGYMPIHRPQVEIIGLISKPQYNYIRCSLIAHPIENDPLYAGVEDWKSFFSNKKIGNMSQQKIPDTSKPRKFQYGENIIESFKEYYEAVVLKFKNDINSWTEEHNKSYKEVCNDIDLINNSLKRMDYEFCDKVWRFRCERLGDDIVVQFNKKENIITFNCDEESPLIKKLVKVRNGQNGSNSLDKLLEIPIDIFIMCIRCESTSAGICRRIKEIVNMYNNYYSM